VSQRMAAEDETLVPHIFPTLDRTKHGKTVSFPVGAEVLSRALDGVPQHAMLGCHFTVGDVERRPVKPLEHVLHVVYSKQVRSHHHSKNSDERGVFDPKWSISVFAIPSTMRHQVKTLLVKECLPNVIQPWLMTNGGITGRSGSRGLMIMLDTVNGVLVHETRDGILPDRA
jgi:hypothetical protein